MSGVLPRSERTRPFQHGHPLVPYHNKTSMSLLAWGTCSVRSASGEAVLAGMHGGRLRAVVGQEGGPGGQGKDQDNLSHSTSARRPQTRKPCCVPHSQGPLSVKHVGGQSRPQREGGARQSPWHWTPGAGDLSPPHGEETWAPAHPWTMPTQLGRTRAAQQTGPRGTAHTGTRAPEAGWSHCVSPQESWGWRGPSCSGGQV